MTAHKTLPKPPSLKKTLGPSFILLGLALGSGELILWPYLAANYGLGLLWGGLLGITFQYILNTEVMRYSLAWGESVFVGFRKLSVLIPIWFIISTFIPWSLPGFSSATANIIASFLELSPIHISESVIAAGLLIITGLILSLGNSLYRTMEFIQRGVIMLGLPFIIIVTVVLTTQQDWLEAIWGLVGRGGMINSGAMDGILTESWWFFPKGIALASFLGAFAYSGAGGNLNLAQSYYIKEKGFGMGKYSPKITSLFSKGNKSVSIEGRLFADTPSNNKRWQEWWRLITTEHFLIFWLLGLLTIIFLTVLAKTLVYGTGVEEGLSFIFAEADALAFRTSPIMGTLFLILAAVMLFSTQLGVLEASSRIISENIMLVFYKKGKKYNLSRWFYIALWSQIVLGITIYGLGWNEPRFLLTLAAVLNGAAMFVAFPLIFWLNRNFLPRAYHPSNMRKAGLMLAFIFFGLFMAVTLGDFHF